MAKLLDFQSVVLGTSRLATLLGRVAHNKYCEATQRFLFCRPESRDIFKVHSGGEKSLEDLANNTFGSSLLREKTQKETVDSFTSNVSIISKKTFHFRWHQAIGSQKI